MSELTLDSTAGMLVVRDMQTFRLLAAACLLVLSPFRTCVMFSFCPINSPLQNFTSLQFLLPANPVAPRRWPVAERENRPSADNAIFLETRGENCNSNQWRACMLRGLYTVKRDGEMLTWINACMLLEDWATLSKINCIHQFVFVFLQVNYK